MCAQDELSAIGQCLKAPETAVRAADADLATLIGDAAFSVEHGHLNELVTLAPVHLSSRVRASTCSELWRCSPF